MTDVLSKLWEGPLAEIREGTFSGVEEKQIRDVLKEFPTYSDLVPVEVARGLWFMPMFLEWQIKRVAEKSPENIKRFYDLSSWVTERVGEILGNP